MALLATDYETMTDAAYEAAYALGVSYGDTDAFAGVLRQDPLGGAEPTFGTVLDHAFEAAGVGPEDAEDARFWWQDGLTEAFESGYWAAHAGAHGLDDLTLD